jgi:hypothetical protein
VPNSENLKPFEFTSNQSRDEARKNGTIGGRKSGEARRHKKFLREIFESILDIEIDYGDKIITNKEAMALGVLRKAMEGDLRAFELIRDTVGEEPVDRMASTDSEGNDPVPIIPSEELLALMEKRKATLDARKQNRNGGESTK